MAPKTVYPKTTRGKLSSIISGAKRFLHGGELRPTPVGRKAPGNMRGTGAKVARPKKY